MSVISRLVTFVLMHPGHSAQEIANKMGLSADVVNRGLRDLVKQREIRRVPKEGPHGGYGYHGMCNDYERM